VVKKGLGDTYDKTVVPRKIRAYLDLTKPASSVGIMLSVPFATLMYAELYTPTGGVQFLLNNWTTVVHVSASMFFLHGASQAMNMVEDAHIDKQTQHKGMRPIPSGVVSKEEARTLAWIFMFAGITRAFTVNTDLGLFAIVLAFFGVFYNLDPIRAKEYLWINLAWQAASRGLLLYPATFAAWGAGFELTPWVMGFAAFMLVLAMQNTADFSDVEMDAEFGIITPAVYHDLPRLTSMMAGIVTVMFAFLAVSMQLGWIPMLTSLVLLTIPVYGSLLYLWKYPKNISSLGGNNPTWYVYYLTLASMYILPGVELAST
jgi:4-hydroxybenzoate polyprenyltransferase